MERAAIPASCRHPDGSWQYGRGLLLSDAGVRFLSPTEVTADVPRSSEPQPLEFLLPRVKDWFLDVFHSRGC